MLYSGWMLPPDWAVSANMSQGAKAEPWRDILIEKPDRGQSMYKTEGEFKAFSCFCVLLVQWKTKKRIF